MHKIRFVKKEGKQYRGFKKKAKDQLRVGLRKEPVICSGGGGADGAQDQQASKRIERHRKAGIVCPAQGHTTYLLNPKNNPVLCEGAQQDRRNTMFLHVGCGRQKLKLHSRLKNPPTHRSPLHCS